MLPREFPSRDFFVHKAHLHNYDCRTLAFLQQLHFELDQRGPEATVLDIGCGHGIALDSQPQFDIAKKSATYWGVEPDPTVSAPECFHHVWSSNFEDADIPAESIDIAYSQMVLEHVMEPEKFLAKVASVLKPSGIFLSLTVNAHSTFARIASTCLRLGVQDAVLRIARGKQLVEEYHYPACYRMTSKPYLDGVGPRFGLNRIDVAFLEADEWLVYFPKGTRWVGNVLTNAFQRNVERYSWLLIRMGK
jgi:SAM-dependent methyltransferase